MATFEIMPKFGLSMEEGTIARWLVAVGEYVKRGEPIAVVEAEKLTNDAVASVDGLMLAQYIAEGESALCGLPICAIGEAGEEIPTPNLQPQSHVIGESYIRTQSSPGMEPKSASVEANGVRPLSSGIDENEIRISPRAKRIAEEHGISVTNIKGTGVDGFITVDDVKALIN
ncbi:MAG: E3 binding domain-containing protein [Lachnospiraceae bacterium]|jgi:pyruvate dehydrogenase E2 component (dihydrolipoamide acetyltransferase)|nr:E3 binding domain-containing protein [Lachnospiraceae bacterium]